MRTTTTKKKAAPKKAVARTPTTAKAMLDLLDRFFAGRAGYAQKEALWIVLSALRGPDDDNVILKELTTERIRGAAFPRATKDQSSLVGALVTQGVVNTAGRELQAGSSHFRLHVVLAVEELRLMGRTV